MIQVQVADPETWKLSPISWTHLRWRCKANGFVAAAGVQNCSAPASPGKSHGHAVGAFIHIRIR
jgi:hypothetical protein